MARVTVEDCLHVVENRFALCVLSVKRGRQLMSGARPLVEAGREKSPVLSLREVAADKVRFDRDLDDVLAGKYNPPQMDVKLVPAGTGKSAANSAPPSGGLF